MNKKITIEIEVPEVLANQLIGDIDAKTAVRNIKTAWIAPRAEEYSCMLAEREFPGKNFKTASQNQKGFDLISDCGEIVIEVKHTAGHVWSTKPIIGIGAKNKDNSTHFIIFDFHNNRCALIETSKVIAGIGETNGRRNKHNSFRWDERYKDWEGSSYIPKGLYADNTQLFLDNEIKL